MTKEEIKEHLIDLETVLICLDDKLHKHQILIGYLKDNLEKMKRELNEKCTCN